MNEFNLMTVKDMIEYLQHLISDRPLSDMEVKILTSDGQLVSIRRMYEHKDIYRRDEEERHILVLSNRQ